ncbi:hypothetical protein ACWKST_04490 [Limosilactobacillus reuteri]
MPVQQIKHNNDGKFYHIAIDIAKEGAQLFDLTPYVKGRVGDNNFGLLVDWYRQGMLMNVNGAYKPIIDGLVGNFSFDKNGNLKMDDDASPVYSEGKPEDCGPAGQVTYYFPEQMFPKEGIFKGYLGLIDDKGNRYSGVDIWFSVLAGNPRMGIACDYYISELAKAIKESEDDLLNSKKSMQQVVDEFVSKMNDLTNRLETQATTDQAALDALEQKIKQDGLFTQAEADAFKQVIIAILKQYAKIYSNVADMVKDTTVVEGQYARTLGYYSVGDGGATMYKFSETPTDFSIAASNGLNAIPEINEQTVNVKQFGVMGDASADCSDIVNKLSKKYSLYFPAGSYLVEKQLDIYNGIYGQAGTAEQNEYTKKPISSATTFVSGINGTKDVAVIANHGIAGVFKELNIKLSGNESGIIDTGTYTTRIENVLITGLREAYGVKIDHSGSRTSMIKGLVVEADLTENAESIGLYYLTGTDQLLESYWSMGCHTGIHAVACLFYGTNIHVWCGHDKDKITKEWWEGTNSLYLQSSKAYLANVYSDTAKLFIGTNGKSYASVKNLISLFDDTLSAFDTEVSDARIFGESGCDSLHVDGGLIYGSGVSRSLLAFDKQLCSITNATVIVQKVSTPEDYVSVYYRDYLPNTGIGYPSHYVVNYKNQKDKYVEVARMHADGNNGGIAEVRLSDNTDLATKLEITINDGHFKREDIRGNFDLQARYLNDWIIIYAKSRVDDYTVNVDVLGNTAATSFVNYSFIRVNGDTEFPKLIQSDATGLVPISTSADW